jgi:hypothetical protein
MKKGLLSIVACPLCKSPLHFARAESVLVCRAERLAFPVEGERPVLLESSARSLSVEETDRLTRPQGVVPND